MSDQHLRRGVVLCILLGATVELRALSLVSVKEEIQIGRQAQARVRAQVPQLADMAVAVYTRDIGRRLVRVAPGPKYPYSFAVANYREINAFALPGGPVWINRGVWHAATNEAQLAGVIAHEIAHVAQRHAAAQLTKALVTRWGFGLLGALLGNSGGATTAQAAASVLADGMFLKFSRDAERDADRVGLEMLRRAGWDGRGMVELFEMLRREARRDPTGVDVFFSSHPSPADRISALKSATARSRGGRRDSREFRAVKRRLLALPPAAAMPRAGR